MDLLNTGGSKVAVIERLDTIISHLAGYRYSSSGNGNDLYLESVGLREDLGRAVAEGRDLPVTEDDLSDIEQQIADLRQFERMAGLPSLETRLNLTASTLLECCGDLHGYAAHDAAKQLLVNWKAALADGASLAELVGDVDRVVELLQDFKNAAAALDVTAPGLGDERLQVANQSFLDHEFPGAVTRSGDAWLIPTPNEWNLYVQAQPEDPAEEPRQLLMRVVFAPDSAEVVDTYAVDRATGARLDAVSSAELSAAPVEFSIADGTRIESADAALTGSPEDVLQGQRLISADKALEAFEFGGDLEREEDGGWYAWERSGDDYSLRVDITSPSNGDSRRLEMTVSFRPGSDEVLSVRAIDIDVGIEVGRWRGLPSAASNVGVDAQGFPGLDDLDDLLDIPDLPEGKPQSAAASDMPNLDDLLPPM